MKEISENLLIELSDFVQDKIGLHFPKNRWRDLQRGVIQTYRELGYKNVNDYVKLLFSSNVSKDNLHKLAANLTIGETYFFRDKKIFNVLKKHILTSLIKERWQKNKVIRIWSAACSTGEEPYSIAMLIDELLPGKNSWNIFILATDLNIDSLNKAKNGVYTDWSFRDVPNNIKTKYFAQKGKNSFRISPNIKEMVLFNQLNFAEANYPSVINNTQNMDIIFCRNVLMYFNENLRKMVINRLYGCLNNKGWLIVSPGEADYARCAGLNAVRIEGTTLYQKVLKDNNKNSILNNNKKISINDINLSNNSSFNKFSSFNSNKTNINESYFNESLKIETTNIVSEKKLNFQQYTSEDFFDNKNGSVNDIKKSSIIDNKNIDNNKKITNFKKNNSTFGIEIDSSNNQSYLFKEAFQLYQKGNYKSAIEKLHKLHLQDEKNIQIINLISKSYANIKELDLAKKWCEKSIENDKLNSESYYLLSTIYQEIGDNDEAVKYLKQTLYLDSEFILAYFTMGNILKKHNKINESKKYFQNAVNLLNSIDTDEIVPHSDGITAGSLMVVLKSMLSNM